MNGESPVPNATTFPLGLKVTPLPVVGSGVTGSAYLPPNPGDHGYAETKGDVLWANAISVPAELNATELPWPVGAVAGSAYLTPNPADHG